MVLATLLTFLALKDGGYVLSAGCCVRTSENSVKAKFAFWDFSEVQRKCVGMGGASAPCFLYSNLSWSHPTSTHSAAVMKRMS